MFWWAPGTMHVGWVQEECSCQHHPSAASMTCQKRWLSAQANSSNETWLRAYEPEVKQAWSKMERMAIMAYACKGVLTWHNFQWGNMSKMKYRHSYGQTQIGSLKKQQEVLETCRLILLSNATCDTANVRRHLWMGIASPPSLLDIKPSDFAVFPIFKDRCVAEDLYTRCSTCMHDWVIESIKEQWSSSGHKQAL